MNDELIVVSNLKVKFKTDDGYVHAVNGISYHVNKSETIGVVGESGCGKSVSMLAIMGLLNKQNAAVSGCILFKGKDLTKLSQKELQRIRGNRISMVFQDPISSLNPLLPVKEQLTEALIEHLKISRQDAYRRGIELLNLVGIPMPKNQMDNYPHQFSGGMRQRLMIAMALSCNPDLLIADEPTTALDVTIQAQILKLVKDLRKKFGMSLIWITHDLGVVAGLVDRVMVMYAGQLMESGNVDEVYETPLHPYTIGLLGSVPKLDTPAGASLSTIDGMPPSLYELPCGCPFSPRCKFVKTICKEKKPPLMEIKKDHYSACWIDVKTGNIREHKIVT